MAEIAGIECEKYFLINVRIPPLVSFPLHMPFSEQQILRSLFKSRERISAVTWMVVNDTHVVEDIFQNVVIKSLTSEVSFDAEGPLLSWAIITARREGIDWIRKNRKLQIGIDEEILDLIAADWASGATPVPERDRIQALRDCLEQLPEKSRQLLNLRYTDGYDCGEIAEKIETKLDAVYKRLSRLHAGLRQCIETRMIEIS